MDGVAGQSQVGSGQVLVTGKGGGMSSRARRRLEWHGVVERKRCRGRMSGAPLQARVDGAKGVGRSLIEGFGREKSVDCNKKEDLGIKCAENERLNGW